MRRALLACAILLAAAVAVSAVVTSAQSSPQQPARQRRLFPPQDLGLLSAPDRDDWNKPDLIMDALGVADGATVADLGAGGGWFTIRLARRVGPNGLVYAQDIQPQMIEAINRRVQQEALTNVRTVLGTPSDARLPAGDGGDALRHRGYDCASCTAAPAPRSALHAHGGGSTPS